MGSGAPLSENRRPGLSRRGLADDRTGGRRLRRGLRRPSGSEDARGPQPDQLGRQRRSALRSLPLFECLRGGRPSSRGPARNPARLGRIGGPLGCDRGPDLERRHPASDRHQPPGEPRTDRSRVRPFPPGPPALETEGTLDRRPQLPDRALLDARHQRPRSVRPVRSAASRRSADVPDLREHPPRRQRARSRAIPTSWHAPPTSRLKRAAADPRAITRTSPASRRFRWFDS